MLNYVQYPTARDLKAFFVFHVAVIKPEERPYFASNPIDVKRPVVKTPFTV